MSSPTAFFQNSTTQQIARFVFAATRIPVSVILAQMSIETAYGTSQAYLSCHNPAGIKGSGTCDPPYAEYATYQAGAQGYANFYLDNSYYASVLATARSGASAQQVAIALGQSPWAGSHYTGHCGSDGCQLIEQINTYQLTQYDTPVSTTTPPVTVPASAPASAPASVPWGYLVLGLTGIALGGGVLVLAVSPRSWNEFTAWEHEETHTVHHTRTISARRS